MVLAALIGLALLPLGPSPAGAAPPVNTWEQVTPSVIGDPAVVTATNGDWTDAFVRKGQGITHHRYGTSSSAPQDLGGIARSDPTAGALGSNAYVFVVGADKAIWYRVIGSNGAPAGGWQSLGGIVDLAPTAVTTGANQLTLYAVGGGSDHRLFARQNNGGTWGSWILIGGLFTDPVDASGANVVGHGFDNAVWRIAQTGPSSWGPFTSLGGNVIGAPSVDGVDVASMGPDNQVYLTKVGCNASCKWFPTGGYVKRPPVLTPGGMHVNVNLQVHGVGFDNNVMADYWGSGRSGWQNLGGGIRSRLAVAILDPAVCNNACYGDRIYAVGMDGALYTRLG